MSRVGLEGQNHSSVQNLEKNQYYQQLQDSIKEKAQQLKDQQQPQHKEPQTQKVAETAKVSSEIGSQKLNSKDQVSIGESKWQKNSSGDFELSGQTKDSMLTSTDLKNDGLKILKLMGQKVNLSDKLPQLKQSFMQNVVQSKSHNFFTSKYAMFKVGHIGHLLSNLGVSQEELQKLQKKALEGAKDDNIELMQENIYNIMLTEIIHGKSRKVKRSLAMFLETEKQLMSQMNKLGFPDYWTQVRLYEERVKQLKKIKEELNKEKIMLTYQYQYAIQEGR